MTEPISVLAEVQAERRALGDELVELRGRIAYLCGYYDSRTDPGVIELVAALREAAGLQAPSNEPHESDEK